MSEHTISADDLRRMGLVFSEEKQAWVYPESLNKTNNTTTTKGT